MAEGDDGIVFGTTRGKLLLPLCRGPRTVNELADQLGGTASRPRSRGGEGTSCGSGPVVARSRR